jgi:hypothetical protein
MKPQLSFLIVVTAALSACAFSSLAAAPKTPSPIVYRVANVRPRDNPSVTLGSSRYEVLSWMGRPTREITSDFWIYAGYSAKDFSPADRDGCATVLVIFHDNVVSDLKLANKRAIEIYTVSPKARQRDLVASGR